MSIFTTFRNHTSFASIYIYEIFKLKSVEKHIVLEIPLRGTTWLKHIGNFFNKFGIIQLNRID